MKCPKDATELRRQPYENGILVDICPSCEGMWLDEGELEKIQETPERDYSDEIAQMPNLGYKAELFALQKKERTLLCPRCGREMEKLEHARCSQVLVDACPKCRGVWLDQGEIESLEIFFERSRSQVDDMRRGFFASLKSLFTE